MNNTQFSIEKALQFVGDNSSYQKYRLIILIIVITTYATLTCRIPLQGNQWTIIFLFTSGLGQIICPIYMCIKTIAKYIIICCLIGAICFPISSILMIIIYCIIGFFARGFYVSSIIYLNQIGGQKFRAWSMIVVFAVWGLAPLILSLQSIFKIYNILWVYLVILMPFFIGSLLTLKHWQPSPLKLYTKSTDIYYISTEQFIQAKNVLNNIAKQNNRSYLPYNLQGENQDQLIKLCSQKLTYIDLIRKSSMRILSIPLCIFWIYREYIYYSSYIIIPQLGNQISKNLILLSVSQIVAVLMSYPIKLKIKRVNAFFLFTFLIALCCLLSSFTRLDKQCMQKGSSCASKYLYRFSVMLIRFSISLISSILINYTLQIYPANIRTIGFSFCLAISSLGSTILPWLVTSSIYINISGFISFFIFSIIMLYFITLMPQTNGKVNIQNLQQYQNHNQPLFSLQNWATLNFK